MPLAPHDRSSRSLLAAPAALQAEMNVTPMLDVMLVLLIIFMASISARFVIDAHLPDPRPAEHSEAVPIVLEVGGNGHYAINREVVPAAGLAARLTALYLGRPDKRIIIHGERTALYREIIAAMDVARGAGVTVIGVEMRATSR